MITIGKPYGKREVGKSFLCSDIKDEKRDRTYVIWYSVDDQYSFALSADRADAFLLVAFMIAMKSHQDIKVEAPVSPRLLFNLENTIQPIFTRIIPNGKHVHISAENTNLPIFNAKGVGCGCSLGVDSMSSFLKHMSKDVPEEYHVTHLALFNSCQFGYLDQEETEKIFANAVEQLSPFSKEVNMPIVAVNTNLNELYLDSGFVTASSRFIPSTISCVLALQRLWGKYVFASSYSVTDFCISQIDHSHAEAAFVPLLSTESTEIILSNPAMNRVEKTEYISKSPLTPKYLDVCWAEQQANGIAKNRKWIEGKTKRNCGWCDKCLRTLFTLELLGCSLHDYCETFELRQYYSHRAEFIQQVCENKDSNVMYNEIYDLMGKKNFPLPLSLKLKLRIKKSLIFRAYRRLRRSR